VSEENVQLKECPFCGDDGKVLNGFSSQDHPRDEYGCGGCCFVFDNPEDWNKRVSSKTVVGDAVAKAIVVANNAIYFNDSSDYLTALYEVCEALGHNIDECNTEYIEGEE
jgi:hypothetical protein